MVWGGVVWCVRGVVCGVPVGWGERVRRTHRSQGVLGGSQRRQYSSLRRRVIEILQLIVTISCIYPRLHPILTTADPKWRRECVGLVGSMARGYKPAMLPNRALEIH